MPIPNVGMLITGNIFNTVTNKHDKISLDTRSYERDSNFVCRINGQYTPIAAYDLCYLVGAEPRLTLHFSDGITSRTYVLRNACLGHSVYCKRKLNTRKIK